MQRLIAQIYGVVTSLLALVGLLAGSGYILGGINVDPAPSWIHAVLALLLLYVGFAAKSADLLRASLWLVGIAYVSIGVFGLINARLWGVAPSGLTGFDIAAHLVVGLLAVAVVARKEAPARP